MAKKDIQPTTVGKPPSAENPDPRDIRPFLQELQLGGGDAAIRFDREGFWVGAERFDAAPLAVSWLQGLVNPSPSGLSATIVPLNYSSTTVKTHNLTFRPEFCVFFGSINSERGMGFAARGSSPRGQSLNFSSGYRDTVSLLTRQNFGYFQVGGSAGDTGGFKDSSLVTRFYDGFGVSDDLNGVLLIVGG